MPKGGKRGTVKGEVYPVFEGRQSEFKRDAANHAASDIGGTGGVQRRWQLPSAPPPDTGPAAPFDGDLLDVPKLHEPHFVRDDINTTYQQCLSDADDPGTIGDTIALKLQMDRVAAEERAFRTRHATLVRCFAHGAGRRYGQGSSLMFPSVVTQVSRILAAGGAS